MSIEAMKQALEAAYLAGFNASGEGYNGEYPFGDKMQDPAENRVWKKDRDNYVSQAIADLEKQEHGSPEDMYVGMHKHLNCPHCGGSGHIDDVAEKQEPVAHFGSAYVNENGVHVTTVLGPVAIPQDAKLYTHPQPKREPLTDEQIEKIIKANIILQMNLAGIRQDFEAAHGIKEPT